MQILQGFLKFVCSREIESARHRYITDPGPNHIGEWDGWQRNSIARAADTLCLAVRWVLDRYLHNGAAWSQQELAHFAKSLSPHRLSIHFEYAIPEPQTRTRCRGIFECCSDVRVYLFALAQVADRRADAKVFRALFGLERCVFDRVKVGRVWLVSSGTILSENNGRY